MPSPICFKLLWQLERRAFSRARPKDGEKDGGEDPNYSYDDQEFDEGEASQLAAPLMMLRPCRLRANLSELCCCFHFILVRNLTAISIPPHADFNTRFPPFSYGKSCIFVPKQKFDPIACL